MSTRREPPMQKVLLTFVGFHDPFRQGPVDDEEVKGPVLYLLGVSPPAVSRYQRAAGGPQTAEA